MNAPSGTGGLRRPLLIFPFNGNGIEAADCLGDRLSLMAFIDDTPAKHCLERPGVPAVLDRSGLARWPAALVLAVPGGPTSFRSRGDVIESLGLTLRRFARVIHPSAHVSPRASVGDNVLLMAGVVVSAGAVIGDHVCVLPNSVVHHGARIGAYSLVGANVTVAGHAVVGDNCYVASGSSVRDGVRIGDRTMVGLGSVVLGDVEADSVVAGCPARRLSARTEA